MKYVMIFLGLISLYGCVAETKPAPNPDVLYTCAMHPEVVSATPGRCPICNMQLTPARKDTEQESKGLTLTDQQMQLGNITIDTIDKGLIGTETILAATLKFDQSRFSSVSARITCRIEKLYFKNVGDYVAKGSSLFELYSEELNNAKQGYLLALERRQLFKDQSLIDFEALIESARNKLLLWGMTESQITAMTESKKISLATTFFSPQSGYITELNVSEGGYVMEGGTIVQLASLATLWAEAELYASRSFTIEPNSIVTVQFPGTGIANRKGRIEFLNPEIDPDVRFNLVRVSISNPGNVLKPGMPAQVVIHSPQRATLSLPVEALIRQQGSAIVWVQTAPNRFVSRMVQTGMETDNRVEITSGLNAGDAVVVSGAYLLHSEYIFRNGSSPMTQHSH